MCPNQKGFLRIFLSYNLGKMVIKTTAHCPRVEWLLEISLLGDIFPVLQCCSVTHDTVDSVTRDMCHLSRVTCHEKLVR